MSKAQFTPWSSLTGPIVVWVFYCNEEIMSKSTYREKKLFELTVPKFRSSSRQGIMAVGHSQLRANLSNQKQREWIQNGVSL